MLTAVALFSVDGGSGNSVDNGSGSSGSKSFSNQTFFDGGTGKSNTVDGGSGGTANKGGSYWWPDFGPCIVFVHCCVRASGLYIGFVRQDRMKADSGIQVQQSSVRGSALSLVSVRRRLRWQWEQQQS